MMNKHTPIVSKQCVEGKGQLANLTLYGATAVRSGNADTYLPLKSSDAKMTNKFRYGGFSSATTSYFFLVEHTRKKKRIRTIEMVPLYLANRIDREPSLLDQYCEDVLKLSDFSIRIRKIKLQSLIKLNGFLLRITGRTEDRLKVRNAVSMVLDSEWVGYLKKLEKIKEENIQDTSISSEKNELLYQLLMEKHRGIYSKRPNAVIHLLEDGKERFSYLSVYDQSVVLCNILSLTSMNSSPADLQKIGGNKNSGEMKISNVISNANEAKLINQSVTGLFENVIDLKTV